ncbi:hypothetical protein KC19_1G071100 [Ceratodon purpureus]|nr:hypothetical protein KC19_1G071100 [Ceratodon purpureus]
MAMAASVDAGAGKTLESWEALAGMLGKEELPERLPGVKRRVFEDGQEPALVFYRDNSSWCPYCQRVWLQLEEKRIPYEVEKINMRCYGEKPAWFTKMVPSGLLPVLELDGKIITESMDIMFLIEQRFPDYNPLLPSGGPELAAVDSLLGLERRLAGAWMNRLRSSWPDMNGFENTMDKVNSALQRFGGPYFLGSKFSMVDAVYAPFLERIAASMPYWPGVKVRGNDRWPAVNSWFDAMDSRPAYQAMKSDDFTHTHDLEPQIGPCRSAPAGQAYRDLINGKNGSWDLPLKPEETAWGFDDGTGKGGAKEEAARTLIKNHEKVVSFALRPVRDGEKYKEMVDLAFHLVANALMLGVENVPDSVNPSTFPPQVAVAAAYLRDRVGVPRDMSYPAARQLRAHLNWLIRSLGSDL